MDLSTLIGNLRREAGSASVPARIEGEQQARQLLDAKAGRFDTADGAALSHAVQTSAWHDQVGHSRFRPAFAGGAWSGLLRDIDAFNAFTERMWRGPEADALEALDAVYHDHSVLPFAGTSYPSLVMYLRDPERYMVANSRLVRGLEKVTGISYPLRSADEYLSYCSAAHHLRHRYGLAVQEVDLLLWGATEPMFSASYDSEREVEPVTDRVMPAEAAPSDEDELQAWLSENDRRAAELPEDYLASRAAAAPGTPIVRGVAASALVRNAYVSAYAKRLAKGICDLCGEDGPFLDRQGSPYLEAHHVVWLSRGGRDSIDNVAALCPNCHRQVHVLDDEADHERLLGVVAGRG